MTAVAHVTALQHTAVSFLIGFHPVFANFVETAVANAPQLLVPIILLVGNQI